MSIYSAYSASYPATYGSTEAASEIHADLIAFSKAIGPRRVKTKEVEIEAHSPLALQRLIERQGRKPVTLSQFPKTLVRPKNVTICGDEEYP